MASNRMIRDWTDSETIDSLSDGAEIFFTRLIMKADDFGNYVTNPKLIKSALFPLKNHSIELIELWIDEIYHAGLIGFYEFEGKKYLQIIDFGQKKRRMVAIYPTPDGQLRTCDGQATDKCPPEEKRREVEDEEEWEVEREDARNFEWFEKQMGEVFLESMVMTHKDKDLSQSLKESFAHLAADPVRLRMIDASGCKRLLNTWLSNQKANGKSKQKILHDLT